MSAFGRLADDRGLHPVVKDLARHAAEGGEGRDMAAQNRLQILMGGKTGLRGSLFHNTR